MMKKIKRKSVAFYIKDEFGGLTAVSKNAVTRLTNKMKKGNQPGDVYNMPAREVEE